jgi:hypothetical protein
MTKRARRRSRKECRQQRVVFIAGNHDLQLNFAAVRALLTRWVY